jgi:sulfide:quinone oxidoreductase
MSDAKTILILGGGVGGLVTARSLRKRLPRNHRIILVDKESEHVFAPSLLWLMVDDRSPDSIKRPLARLERHGIEVRCGEIERIDPAARTAVVAGEAIAADFLVISLGAAFAPEAIPGLSEAGHNFYTLEGAETLRDALREFSGGRVVVLTAAPAYKCPAAPYEAALLIESYLRKRRVGQFTVDLYAAEPGPMGVAGPDVSQAVRQMVDGRGIPYHPEHQVVSVDAPAKQLTFVNGTTAEYDLLAYVPPHRAPSVVADAGLTAESGWIAVDRHTMATSFEGVYAIGDVVGIPLKLGKPLPKAGVFARGEAEVVAANIAATVAGKTPDQRFDGHGECFIEMGDGRAGFGGGDFYGDPEPIVNLKQPGRRWHWGKVLFEKQWLWRML